MVQTIPPELFSLPPGLPNSLLNQRLQRSHKDIATEMSSYLSGVAQVPENEFNDELLEATGRQLIKYVDHGIYLQLGSFYKSFCVSGMMEVLYYYSRQIVDELFEPNEQLHFSTYCEKLAAHLVKSMDQEKGLGWEIAKPLDRCLYGMPIVLPGTMVLGMGLHLTKQEIKYGDITAQFAHEDGYVNLDSILQRF